MTPHTQKKSTFKPDPTGMRFSYNSVDLPLWLTPWKMASEVKECAIVRRRRRDARTGDFTQSDFFLIECFLFNVNKSAKESKGLYYENIEAFRHQVKKVQRRDWYKMTFVHH